MYDRPITNFDRKIHLKICCCFFFNISSFYWKMLYCVINWYCFGFICLFWIKFFWCIFNRFICLFAKFWLNSEYHHTLELIKWFHEAITRVMMSNQNQITFDQFKIKSIKLFWNNTFDRMKNNNLRCKSTSMVTKFIEMLNISKDIFTFI